MAMLRESWDVRPTSFSPPATRLGLTALLVALFLSPSPGEEPAAKKAAAPPMPMFTKDVAPILQRKCQNCHRRDHVGPFALETYEQARKRAEDIAYVVGERSMPPWKPAPGVGPKLKHDQSLSAAEIAVLKTWAEGGTPEGDPKDLPPPPRFTKGWKLGTPDLVLVPDEGFCVPASGPDTYRCFVLPTNLVDDAHLSAIDFRPGSGRVVHHINAYLDVSGEARKRDAADPGPGYTSFAGPGIPDFEALCFWTAGHDAAHCPKGIGLRLPRQVDIVLQVHYHPTGKPEVDKTRVGLYYSRDPIKQTLHWNAVSNSEFRLPANDSNVEVEATWFIPVDLDALAISPHMHHLGHDMRITLTYPNGRKRDLIQIVDWDPSWQNAYYFNEPITLPKGSVVKVLAHFDNSSGNPSNPNQPPKLVKWGQSATDEMCEGFLAVVKKGQDLIKHPGIDDLSDIFAQQRIRNRRKQAMKQAR